MSLSYSRQDNKKFCPTSKKSHEALIRVTEIALSVKKKFNNEKFAR